MYIRRNKERARNMIEKVKYDLRERVLNQLTEDRFRLSGKKRKNYGRGEKAQWCALPPWGGLASWRSEIGGSSQSFKNSKKQVGSDVIVQKIFTRG